MRGQGSQVMPACMLERCGSTPSTVNDAQARDRRVQGEPLRHRPED